MNNQRSTRKALSRLAPLAAALLALGAAPTYGATTTGTLTVTAAVAAVCQVSNATLAFGTYNPGIGNLDQQTNIGVRCTRGTPFTVSLNGGGGTIANRRMASTATPAEQLQYQLYTTAARTVIFGDGTTGSTVPGTGNGMGVPQTVSVPVYGRVPDNAANQGAAALNDFTDTVQITVTY